MACCPQLLQNSPLKGAPQFSQCVSGSGGNFDRRRRPKMPRRLGGSSATEDAVSASMIWSSGSVMGAFSFYRSPDAMHVVVVLEGLEKLAGVRALLIG